MKLFSHKVWASLFRTKATARRLVRACSHARTLLLASVCCLPWKGATSDAPPDRHWSFQRLSNITPPTVQAGHRNWIQSPLDQFILAKLSEQKLQPAPPADKRTLIRRATFDLTGLPATPEEIGEFLRDDSPVAFARVVDRLLASPRYGERWGRHWLDVARYSDSNGLDENLVYASAWRYRDYVIAAFNKDKPYDQFIREQLAGDLLGSSADESERQEHLIATGFLSLGAKMLAEDDPMKMEMDIVDEQVDTVGRAFMGLTLGCARCHDHKFDPIPTADYYSLAGIFKSSKTMENFKVVAQWHEHVLASGADQERFKAQTSQIAETKQEIERRTKLANAHLLDEARGQPGAYLLASSTLFAAKTGDRTTEATERLASERGLNAEFLKQWHEYLRRIANDSNSVLHAWNVFTAAGGRPPLSALPRWLGDATCSTLEELAARYQEQFWKAEQAWRKLRDESGEAKVTKLPDEALEPFRAILHDPKGPYALPPNPSKYYPAETLADLKRLDQELKAREASLKPLPKAMGIKEGNVADLPIHVRGSYLTPGRIVPRQFLAVIDGENRAPLNARQSGRLQLAHWLTEPNHPLTSRVMVNRIWRGHFGAGLVRSLDNFGRLGEAPSNQPLLDWLARSFIESGWSVKALHRLIMLSSTYQMSSAFSETSYAADPENRLHWRKSRWRLEAEAIRDSILAVADQLELSVGGSLLRFKDREYVTSTANRNTTPYDANRRAVYLPVIRSAMYDVFLAFDFSDPSVSNGDRATTTVAPQALFMMNSPLVAEQSKRLAELLLAQSGLDDRARIERLHERLFGRLPSSVEIERACNFLKRCTAEYGIRELPKEELRVSVWQSLCRTLLASNEFIYVE